jgi:CRP/FNR family transcriptional regulator, nitrogen oxide reductase regulator
LPYRNTCIPTFRNHSLVKIARPDGTKNISHLARSSFFSGLSYQAVEEIIASSRGIRKVAGSWFFRQGEPAVGFYLLVSGYATIHHLTLDGAEALVRIMVPLEIFGTRSVLLRKTSPGSARAVKDCEALFWPGSIMRKLLLEHPELALNALQITSTYMIEFAARNSSLITQSIEQRIARVLLELAARIGRWEGRTVVLDVVLPHKDVGQMVGASVFSVSRIFAAWIRSGLLRRDRGKILLRHIASLNRIAAALPQPVHNVVHLLPRLP